MRRIRESITPPRILALGVVGLCFLVLGVLVPKLLIAEVQLAADDPARPAARYALVRVGNAAGPVQHLLRMRTSVVSAHPGDPACDWGYQERITSVVTVRTYTLWAIPLETWEVTCDSETLVSAPW